MKKHIAVATLLLSSLMVAETAQSAPITFNISITDFDVPSSYSVSYTDPTVSLTGLVSWTFDVSAELTDAGGDGISLTPWLGSIYGFLINGVLVGTDSLGTQISDYAATYSGSYDCGGGCSSIGLSMHFTGSGGSDRYDFANIFEVTEADTTVPEPGIAMLFLMGLTGLGFMRCFSRSTRNS